MRIAKYQKAFGALISIVALLPSFAIIFESLSVEGTQRAILLTLSTFSGLISAGVTFSMADAIQRAPTVRNILSAVSAFVIGTAALVTFSFLDQKPSASCKTNEVEASVELPLLKGPIQKRYSRDLPSVDLCGAAQTDANLMSEIEDRNDYNIVIFSILLTLGQIALNVSVLLTLIILAKNERAVSASPPPPA